MKLFNIVNINFYYIREHHTLDSNKVEFSAVSLDGFRPPFCVADFPDVPS